MDEKPDANRMRPSDAAMALVMAAGRERSLAIARKGIDALDAQLSRTSLESIDVLKQFYVAHASIAERFMEQAGIDPQAMAAALDRARPAEPQPDPPKLREDASEEGRKLYELAKQMDDERRAKGEAAPFSRSLKEALRLAKGEAPTGTQRFAVGTLVAALLTVDSNARAAALEVADPERWEGALAWIKTQADPEGDTSPFGDLKINQRNIIDAVWPSIQAKMEDARGDQGRSIREEQYRANPAAYEEPLDVAKRLGEHRLEPENDYTWRSGVLLRAAENEARIRRAPEAKLDHLLVALLRDGTDTAAFLDGLGVDRQEWSRRMDQSLPRFEEGPRWPPNARDLNMSIHSNRSYRVKPLPEGRDIESLSKEERKEHLERIVDSDLRFTDLRYLAKVPDEPDTLAYALFAEAEITPDRLMAAIVALEKGDPDWWKRLPDLVAQLRDFKPRHCFAEMERAALCVAAAQYEARMRNAAKAEFDDLLVALLVPGTDLWQLLEDVGADPARLHDDVAALRPRFESGPTFPDTREELNPAAIMTKEGFSDLLFLLAQPWQPRESPGLRLLQERGLSPERVDERLQELGVVPL